MEKILKTVWEYPVTGWIFVVAGLATAIAFIHHSPNPGIAISVLGVVAVVMSIRPLSYWEKFFYIALVFALLYAEIHAITVDRNEQDRHQLEDRAAQDLSFKTVRDAQDADFQATAGRLESALAGIKTTLQTSDLILKQTTPHALFGAPHEDDGVADIRAGSQFRYNITAVNSGDETAHKFEIYSAKYMGKPDDLPTEKILYMQFEKDWKSAQLNLAVDVPTNSPLFTTFKSPVFTEADADQIAAATMTLYTFTRISYADSGGSWYSDNCESMQVPLQQGGVMGHPCDAKYNKKRYRPTRP